MVDGFHVLFMLVYLDFRRGNNMVTRKEKTFATICILALGLSTFLQAIGLTWMAIFWLGIENYFFIGAIFLPALVVGILPDTIMIIAETSEDLSPTNRKIIMGVGAIFSISLSAISSYVAVLISAKNGEIGTIGGAIFLSALLIQLFILLAEWLTKNSLLGLFFGEQGNEKIRQIEELKIEAQLLSEQFQLSDLAAQKLDNLEQKIAQSHSETFQILARFGQEIQDIKNRPMPKLSAPTGEAIVPHSNSTDQQKIEFLFMVRALVLADAFTLSKLAKMWGMSAEKLKGLLAEVKD